MTMTNGNILKRNTTRNVSVIFSFKDAADEIGVDPRVISGVVVKRGIPFATKGTMSLLDASAMQELREVLSPPPNRQ